MPYDNQPAPFVIEKGVPVPPPKRRHDGLAAAIRALAAAQVGDSVQVYLPNAKNDRVAATMVGRMAIGAFGNGWYTARSLGNRSVRIWKIAEPKGRA